MFCRALLAAFLASTCSALVFCPNARSVDQMWDTWLYRGQKGWLLNYLVKHGTSRWNGVSSALSVDGAHFADVGVSIRKDCANASDCAVWLGSGSVYKLLYANGNATDEFVMNYSQEYDCDGGNCQSIFFARSTDLLNWTPVAPDAARHGGTVFKYNESDYKVGGRWDCIAVLPRPGGGYYGYWTATPTPQEGKPGFCGAGKTCGAGFGQSDDGLHWTTLPTPGPAVQAEVGGLAQLGGKTFMTFNAGHLFEAPAATGPFAPVARNFNFMTQEGKLAFARLWGEPYTQDPDLVLITHQQVNSGSIYAGLVKRAVLGSDGVLRAQWWDANDVLKGDQLTVTATGGIQTTECVGGCLTSGLWLEGDLAVGNQSGLWLQTTKGGFGLLFSTAGFALGEMPTPGQWASKPLLVDRSMTSKGTVQWRALARNAWSQEGMVEFFVDEVLALPFTVAGAFTGKFAAIDDTTQITAVYRLTLPQQ